MLWLFCQSRCVVVWSCRCFLVKIDLVYDFNFFVKSFGVAHFLFLLLMNMPNILWYNSFNEYFPNLKQKQTAFCILHNTNSDIEVGNVD